MSREYLPRALEDRLLEVSSQFPVVLLTGARQVGKTTLLRHLCGPERRYVTLDDPVLRDLAVRDPALFLQRFPPPVLVDEVQYAPALLPYVKMAVDARGEPGMFWLTGSQQLAAMRHVTESLAGRVGVVRLAGFSWREAHRRETRLPPFVPTQAGIERRAASAARTDLEAVFRRVWTGGLPALASGAVAEREVFFASYVQTYLERDVRDLARVGDLLAFGRFVRACAARTGQLLNLSDLAREVDVSVPTAKAWLSVLEASHQVILMEPYHTNVTRRLVKRPKLYFLDTGLAAYLTAWSSPATLAAGAMAGPMLETFVVGELLKGFWHRIETPRVWFYRDRDGREVDLVLERDGKLFALEVKLAAQPRPAWRRTFTPLERLGVPVGGRAVVCLAPEPVPLERDLWAVPAGLL